MRLFYWIIAFVILILIIPIITNNLMFEDTVSFLAPNGIAKDNEWIGFTASYFGAIVGGVVSGLFTYLGVKKTLTDKNKSEENDFRQRYRAIIDVQEIYNGEYFLRNLKNKSGRLIVTEQYKAIRALDLEDGYFNYIALTNSNAGKAINCKVRIKNKYPRKDYTHITEVEIPIIFENEKIFVPIDKIHDKKTGLILTNEKYFITQIFVEYQTYAKETVQIIREVNSNEELEKRIGVDTYLIKGEKDKSFTPLFEIKGSKNEWYFLEDIHS